MSHDNAQQGGFFTVAWRPVGNPKRLAIAPPAWMTVSWRPVMGVVRYPAADTAPAIAAVTQPATASATG